MRVPVYNPNQVGFAQTTQARIRPADNDGGVGGAIGAGLQSLGQAGNQMAQAQEALDAEFDDTQSRKLALELGTQTAGLKSEFQTLAGGNAVAARTQTEEAIDKLREEALAKASSPRMKALLAERLTGMIAADKSEILGHTLREAKADRIDTFKGQEAHFAEQALSTDDPVLRGDYIATGIAARRDRLRESGVTGKEAIDAEILSYTDGIHADAVDRMLATPDPDLDLVSAYAAAHEDEMKGKTFTGIMKDLQSPLQEREDYTDYVGVTVGMDAAPEGDVKPGKPGKTVSSAPHVTAVAGELSKAGFSPAVVSGFMGNFEVEGGYGGARGDGGKAAGIAQWHPDRQATFKRIIGKSVGSASHAEQARFVAWEMKNPAQAGMSIAGRDAILNARTPGEAAALIDKHYERSSGQHRQARVDAANRHGGGTDNEPRQRDKAKVYDAIEGRDDWTYEKKERVKKIADREIARDEGLLARERSKADEEATTVVTGLGDKFTSINQIPRSIRDKLSPADLESYTKAAVANSQPKEPPANGSVSTTLNLTRISDPATFMKENLGKYQGQMTRAELDTLLQQQATMRRDAAKPKAGQDVREGIVSAISWGKKYGGVSLGDTELPKVYDTMEAILKLAIEKNGGKVTDTDYQNAFRTATRSVGEGGANYEVLGDVPQTFRDAFVKNWKGRVPPTNGDIQAGWLRRVNQLRGR